jgi:ATP/ADP translocase
MLPVLLPRQPPMTLLAATSTALLNSVLPKSPLVLAAATSTALQLSQSFNDNSPAKDYNMLSPTPRAKSCIYMATAMALHFGGYEFARSAGLALFTSSETGFSSPAAYPFAIGLVMPMSLALLYWYGLRLKEGGPRAALQNTKLMSISVLGSACLALALLPSNMVVLTRALVAILFVFQNSYAHLVYTQQWSFLGSVMTPSEGAKWFSAIAGLSSLVCTCAATIVHTLAHHIGLLGLIGGTCVTLTISLLLADQAYALSEKVSELWLSSLERVNSETHSYISVNQHGFDPAESIRKKQENKKAESPKDGELKEDASLVTKTTFLFRRVPTLAALFGEVVSFQSLSTILNVCFVRQLKETMPLDTDRASFTGRFYALVNGSSGLMHFFVLPLARKYVEPKLAYKVMPMILLPFLACVNWASLGASTVTNRALMVTAAAFFSLKTLDYSVRNVVNEMVYQPLDFESRYLGKEVIGVFANRFGKSGMSLLLSLATASFSVGVAQLSQFSLVTASVWMASSWWLSGHLVSNKEAERQVQERRKKD